MSDFDDDFEPKREKVGKKFVTSYMPLEGENHITGKVPGQPGYKPMTEEQAKQFDEKGNKKPSGGGSTGIGKMSRDITKNYKKGGSISSASSRADGCAVKGKTKGRFV